MQLMNWVRRALMGTAARERQVRSALAEIAAPERKGDLVPIRAAVLAAEIIGFDRLYTVDEAGTVERFVAINAELMESALAKQRPHFARCLGETTIAAFDSALAALSAAVEMHKAVIRREAKVSSERRFAIRIGIYLGLVTIDGGEVGGDTWSLAMHLATKAPSGGIYLSEEVWGEVRDKSGQKFADLGDVMTAHGIPNKRAYAVNLD